MQFTGSNITSLRSGNRSAVLRLINRERSLSRKDIAERLSLTPASVTILCRELLDEGLLRELGQAHEPTRSGRKKILLSLCLDEFYAVSVNMETGGTVVSLVRLDGVRICEIDCKHLSDSPEKAIAQVCEAVGEVLSQSGVERSRVLGVGVGTVGAFDRENGKTAGGYGLWQNGVPIRDMMSKTLDMPVCCDNNIRCFALAELLYGCGRQNDDLLFIKWGPGVGAAMIAHGELYSGGSAGVMELGHYIAEPGGRVCRCGRKGCLETYVGMRVLSERISEIDKESVPILSDKTEGNPEVILSVLPDILSSQIDSPVRRLAEKRIGRLACAAVNSATLLSPSRIILFGRMWNEYTLSSFIRACSSIDRSFDGRFISLSHLSENSAYIGPAALAADMYFFGHNLSSSDRV